MFASQRRTTLTIKIDDDLVYSEEIDGDDPSGLKAYETALTWTRANYPDVAFQWKHMRGDQTGKPPRMP